MRPRFPHDLRFLILTEKKIHTSFDEPLKSRFTLIIRDVNFYYRLVIILIVALIMVNVFVT